MTHPAGLDVVELVSAAIQVGRQVPGALVVPTVLLDRDLLGEHERQRGAYLADAATGWFIRSGMHAVRSRVGGNGYGELIKTIMGWYPRDIEALRAEHKESSASRSAFLTSRGYFTEEALLRNGKDEIFERNLSLMQSMTEDECRACYNSIFAEYADDEGIFVEDSQERPGSPDLLVWHADKTFKLWFFCEVKSLNDHLGPAQVTWIKRSWDQVGGRFLLLLLDS
jgi:hypothetical protein